MIFVIQTTEDRTVGFVSLYNIDLEKGQAEYGRMLIGNEFRKKGYAQDATEALLNYGFNNLGLEEIVLSVIAENAPAIKLYQKLGFKIKKEEGEKIDMVLQKSN